MGSPGVACDLKELLLVPADKGRRIVAIDKTAYVEKENVSVNILSGCEFQSRWAECPQQILHF
jgi:hypothetical protein